MPNEEIFWDPYLPNPLPDSRPNTLRMSDTDSDSLLPEEDPSHVL
jgi:hypothetical protein